MNAREYTITAAKKATMFYLNVSSYKTKTKMMSRICGIIKIMISARNLPIMYDTGLIPAKLSRYLIFYSLSLTNGEPYMAELMIIPKLTMMGKAMFNTFILYFPFSIVFIIITMIITYIMAIMNGFSEI